MRLDNLDGDIEVWSENQSAWLKQMKCKQRIVGSVWKECIDLMFIQQILASLNKK